MVGWQEYSDKQNGKLVTKRKQTAKNSSGDPPAKRKKIPASCEQSDREQVSGDNLWGMIIKNAL